MGLHRAGIPHRAGGVAAAVAFLGSVLSDLGCRRRNIGRRKLECEDSQMLKEHCEEAARLLCAARGGAPVHELPQNCRPQSDADAYEIQDAVIRRLGETVGGWKVGAASADTAAFCAPIWMKMIRSSPASYNAGELQAHRHRGRDRLSARPRSSSARRALRSRRGHRRQRRCIRSSRSSIPAIRISARSTGTRSWPTIFRMAGWSTVRRCRTGKSSTWPAPA